MTKKVEPGDVFGIYEVLSESQKTGDGGRKKYIIRCSVCGKIFEKSAHEFKFKNSVTSHCFHMFEEYTGRIHNKRIRKIFICMVRRCNNKNDKNYGAYGGRGIKVCAEWAKDPALFESWALKNGYKENLTIDRKDSNGPYAPWNCRWITANENSKFRRITNRYEVNGIIDSGKGWSIRLGLPINYINKMTRKHGHDFTQKYIEKTFNKA